MHIEVRLSLTCLVSDLWEEATQEGKYDHQSMKSMLFDCHFSRNSSLFIKSLTTTIALTHRVGSIHSLE